MTNKSDRAHWGGAGKHWRRVSLWVLFECDVVAGAAPPRTSALGVCCRCKRKHEESKARAQSAKTCVCDNGGMKQTWSEQLRSKHEIMNNGVHIPVIPKLGLCLSTHERLLRNNVGDGVGESAVGTETAYGN